MCVWGTRVTARPGDEIQASLKRQGQSPGAQGSPTTGDSRSEPRDTWICESEGSFRVTVSHPNLTTPVPTPEGDTQPRLGRLLPSGSQLGFNSPRHCKDLSDPESWSLSLGLHLLVLTPLSHLYSKPTACLHSSLQTFENSYYSPRFLGLFALVTPPELLLSPSPPLTWPLISCPRFLPPQLSLLHLSSYKRSMRFLLTSRFLPKPILVPRDLPCPLTLQNYSRISSRIFPGSPCWSFSGQGVLASWAVWDLKQGDRALELRHRLKESWRCVWRGVWTIPSSPLFPQVKCRQILTFISGLLTCSV
ncbi:uncharacterized protein LOC125618655 [Marmota marmota marmota]|uniref:uncharacterized protein LOC125618655 n=1 Tax=Marmota marmota marmota TaxID=9994 RepID=UPI0020933D08|nr:uncharacterized protein LOC125618655 [Marmota marmota marmota]